MITIPTVNSLYTSILADLQTTYGTTIPVFQKVFLRALAAVQAGKLKLFYLAIASLQKNIFVDTADSEANGGTLERFGYVKLGRYPYAAVAGKYTLTVTGISGSVIAANSVWKSNDDSTNPAQLLVIDTAYTMPGTTGTITVRALTAGVVSKMFTGDKLTVTAPIAGVNSVATVLAETVQPLEAETTEAYREAAIQAYQLEPQGGAGTDYRLWSADAQGVKAVYPYAVSGASCEINLYVEANLADSTDGKGSAGSSLLTAVQAVVQFDPDTTKPLNERGRKPLGVFRVNYLSITPLNVNITIPTFINLTPAIQAIINAALKAKVDTIRPFVASADVLANKNDILDVNVIIATILLAVPGSSFGAVTFSVGGTPYSSYQFVNGNLPYFNLVTYS